MKFHILIGTIWLFISYNVGYSFIREIQEDDNLAKIFLPVAYLLSCLEAKKSYYFMVTRYLRKIVNDKNKIFGKCMILMYEAQCDQIGRFLKVSMTNIHAKVAQMLSDFFGLLKISFSTKPGVATFWATLEKNWATIYSKIWSHWWGERGHSQELPEWLTCWTRCITRDLGLSPSRPSSRFRRPERWGVGFDAVWKLRQFVSSFTQVIVIYDSRGVVIRKLPILRL